jgi:hypothetical protein
LFAYFFYPTCYGDNEIATASHRICFDPDILGGKVSFDHRGNKTLILIVILIATLNGGIVAGNSNGFFSKGT